MPTTLQDFRCLFFQILKQINASMPRVISLPTSMETDITMALTPEKTALQTERKRGRRSGVTTVAERAVRKHRLSGFTPILLLFPFCNF